MKSKAIAFIIALSLVAGLQAAPEEKKLRQVHTLVIREHWVPDYVVISGGFVVPGAPKPFEIPPDNMAMNGNKTSDLIDNRFNIIGPAKKVDTEKAHVGILEKKPPTDASNKSATPARSGDAASKDKPTFKPLFPVTLTGLDNLVCIYPKPKNDWRGIKHMVVGLDSIKPQDNKLLIINVSAFPISIRSGDGRAATIQPSGHAFITRRAQGESKVRIQAAALIAGQQKLAANTAVTIIPDKLPVLTFVNADPESGNCGVDFLKDSVDYPPLPEPAAKAVAAN